MYEHDHLRCYVLISSFPSATRTSTSESVTRTPWLLILLSFSNQQTLIERAQTMFRSVVDARAVRSVVTECEAIAAFEIIADKWGAAF